MLAAPRLIAPKIATRCTAGSTSVGVRQIWRPVSTSMAKLHFPLTTYITPS
jgi:hypothetical protein